MDDIENIINKYRQELLDFSSQYADKDSELVSVISGTQSLNEADETFTQVNKSSTDQVSAQILPEEKEDADTENGFLRIQVFAGNQFFPVSGATVKVFSSASDNENRSVQYDGITDINGVADNITLPTPPFSLSQTPQNSSIRPFAYYNVTVEHPQYVKISFINVPIFPDTKSIQNVQLVPLTETENSPGETIRIQTEPFIKLNGGIENGSSDRS